VQAPLTSASGWYEVIAADHGDDDVASAVTAEATTGHRHPVIA